MTKIVRVPAGLITRLHPLHFEVLIASEQQDNPYEVGARYHLDTGRFCGTVIAQQSRLMVVNALQDTVQHSNPDIALGMVSYLGLPLLWPDGQLFGTICVFDRNEHHYSAEHESLLAEFKAVIEGDLRSLARPERDSTGTLNKKDEDFRYLYEGSPIPYQSLDSDGRFIEFNRALLDALGYSRAELIGTPFRNILPKESVELYERRFAEFKKSGAVCAHIQLVRKDTQPIHVQIYGRIAYHPDGSFKQTHCVWLDVTERLQAEHALRESEATARALLNTPSILTILLDGDGKILDANEPMAERFHKSRHELIGLCLWDLLAPEVLKIRKEYILRSYNTGKIQRWQDYRAGAWFESCVEPVIDESGTINKVAIVAYDITEHKRAQEALEKSEARYRELVDEAATIILRWDINGNVTFFNEYAQKFFGFSEQEIIGKNVVGTIVPDTEFTGRDLAQLMKDICHDPAKFENNENENIKRSGERVWIAWKNRPICNQAGDLVEIHSVGIDITARKRAEDAMRESEALWRSLADNSPDHIMTLDENLNIRYVNFTAPGISKQDLIGTHLYQYVAKEKQSNIKGILEGVLQSGKPCTYETQYDSPDGETIYYESIAAPRILSGKIVGLTVNARDITAHKQAQQALRTSQDELETRVQERTAELEAINLELKNEIAKRQLAQQALEQERRLFVSGPTVVFKWRVTEGWPVEYVSPNVLGQLGYTADEFTSGKVLFADIVHPEDLLRVNEEIKIHIQSGAPHFEQEYRLAHRNGEYLWLYDFTVVVRNDAGEITHFHGYVVDITERKQTEQKILATENELRGIFDSLQDVYYRTDAQGCIVRVSPSAEQIFGYSPDEMIGQPTAIVWRYPEKRQAMLAAMQANAGMVQNYEAQGVSKDGMDLWVSVNAHYLHDAQGNIAGLEGTIRDITKRKQAEQELKHQKVLFEAVFRDVPDGMLIANVNREVLMCNPALTRIFGYQQQDIVGKQTSVLYESQEEFERQGRERFNLAAEEQLLPYVTNYRRKDGTVFPGETVGTAIRDDAGITIGFIGVIRDITNRKCVEEELQRSRQHFQYLDRVSRVLTAAEDLNAMLWNVLNEMLDIFEVDRTWLLYPCDPQAPTWRVPVEVTRTGYEGAFALGTDIPNKPEAAAVFEQAIKAHGVVTFDLYKMDSVPDLARDFGVRTQMVIALNPKMDKPWLLGMHQCSHNREWSEDDKRLFRDIAERVTGALTNRLLQQQLEQDINKRKRIEAVEKGRSKVLELLAMGAPIEEVLEKLVFSAEECNPQMICSVLLLDANCQHLRYGVAPSLPEFYNQAIDGLEIGPEAGSCGAAAYAGTTVIVEDIMTHPYCKPFRELATKAGIRACWSEPILASNGRVLGTFAIYYREPRSPTAADLEFIRNSARLAGIAIERRHSEEQAVLHQAELAHMSRLNVMGEMATGIAHELNQPLTAIANYASAASKLIDAEAHEADKLISVLDSVQVQAKRASEIIHRLRKFVKKQTLQKSSVDLNNLVADVVRFMEIETKNYNVQVRLQLQNGLPIVYVDSIHIEQVLMNLIRNGLESMMSVNENTRLLTIHTRLNHEGVPLVEIADTGPGIEQETLKQIFEPFVTTKGTKGMGMGLSISRSIVEAHGGRLWAESERGKGARFFLTVLVRAE